MITCTRLRLVMYMVFCPNLLVMETFRAWGASFLVMVMVPCKGLRGR